MEQEQRRKTNTEGTISDNQQPTRNGAKERKNTRIVEVVGGMQTMTLVVKQNKANKAQSEEQNNNQPGHNDDGLAC
jgi:hypothetical protein